MALSSNHMFIFIINHLLFHHILHSSMPGIHQRLAAFEHEGDEAPVPAQEFSEQSAMVTRCLLEYTAGQMSAVSCQKMCHAAVIDGCVHPEVWAVAAIGSWGVS